MIDQLIKRSKFNFYAFGDTISEKDFVAHNFVVSKEKNYLVFSLTIKEALDAAFLKNETNCFDTFVFDEPFVRNKLVSFIESTSGSNAFKLLIHGKDVYEYKLTRIKIGIKSVVFQSFN